MKRLFATILALIMLCTGTCFADTTKMEGEFSIRGGVKFGMTIEEVQAIEGTGKIWEDWNSYVLGNVTSLSYHEDSLAGISCQGGFNNLEYYFGVDDNLRGIRYWYGFFSSALAKDYFDELYEALSQKYGEPLDDSNALAGVFASPACDSFFEGSVTIPMISQWMIEYDDSYVIIDLIIQSTGTHSKTFEPMIGYREITQEEMNSIWTEVIKDAEKKLNERDSDL